MFWRRDIQYGHLFLALEITRNLLKCSKIHEKNLGHLIDFSKKNDLEASNWIFSECDFSKMDHFEILNKSGFLEIFLFSYLFSVQC